MRAGACAAVVLLIYLILAGRLAQLHWTSGPELQRVASRQRIVHEVLPGRPGDIVDCRGVVLAASIETHSMFVVPRKLRDADSTALLLASALDLDPRALSERISTHAAKGFLWVKRRISEDEAARVRALGLPRDEWGFRQEFQRIYPQGLCAAQVIGVRDIDGTGRGGIEAAFDARLRGAPGRRELLQDARGRVLEVRTGSEQPARHGETIRLTVDTYLQLQSERVLDEVMDEWKPRSSCAVVLDPQTGAVLAMASRPTFDPSHPERAPANGWTNRVISDQYEPGSTFKPMIVAWALEQGMIQRDEVFDCELGEWRMGGRVLHDHHRYGALSVSQILAKSSNIGMAKIGVRLTNPRLHDAALAFGFGRRTGIELPAEEDGLVRPLKQWTRYSTGSIPMGQEISATPLQVATAFATLANGGVLVSPHVVVTADLGTASGTTPVLSQVIGAET
ncbi:MAG: penicillin-binding protein 2, partial [Planctomycetaceae bacterium]